MPDKTFRKVKIVSLFLSFFYIGGFIWFGESFISKQWYFIAFNLSPGVALLVLPLLSDKSMNSIFIRILSFILGITALVNNFYMIIQVLSLQHISDIIVAVLQLMAISAIIIYLLQRMIKLNKYHPGKKALQP